MEELSEIIHEIRNKRSNDELNSPRSHEEHEVEDKDENDLNVFYNQSQIDSVFTKQN